MMSEISSFSDVIWSRFNLECVHLTPTVHKDRAESRKASSRFSHLSAGSRQALTISSVALVLALRLFNRWDVHALRLMSFWLYCSSVQPVLHELSFHLIFLWLLHVIVPCPFVILSFLTWSLHESGHCIFISFPPTKMTYYSSLRFTFRLCQNHWGRGLLPWSCWPGGTEVYIHNWPVLSCHILILPTSETNMGGGGYKSIQLLTWGTMALTLQSSTGHLEYWKHGFGKCGAAAWTRSENDWHTNLTQHSGFYIPNHISLTPKFFSVWIRN